MKYQREKKELWRYASKNLITPVHGTTRQPPLPHRLPHQRLPQRQEFGLMTTMGCYDVYGESSASSRTTMSMLRQENVSTPPPPYSSVPELDNASNSIDYRQTFRQQQTYLTDGETETSVSATESDTGYSLGQRAPSRYGCNYVNSGDIMYVDDYAKLNETSTSSSYQLKSELQKKSRRMSPQPKSPTNPQVVTTTTTMSTSSTTSFAATAAKILRNCCGGTFGSSNSVTATATNRNANNNNNNAITTTMSNTCNKQNYEHSTSAADFFANQNNNNNNYPPEQYFNTLMKHLKASQISSLLKAVKSRHDQVTPIISTTSNTSSSNSSSSQRCCVANYQTNCILIRRAEILGEEPYVIACRLFLWRDLKNASELKRLPVCPNERDPVYVCCNPLHWCRILETDTVPPPYQNPRMNQIEGENSQKGINSISFGSTDPDNIRKDYCDLRVRVPESVTTDGEDRNDSTNWCEVAYWEMAQRVGERFPAVRPVVNIFSDKPYTTTGDLKDGMCLKELIEKRTTPSPDDVRYTRQKIGLGVTLSEESDGVWLYNRSTVPVFVYSPTLTESWYRVCRVEPGDCLRAFDKYRAQSMVHTEQFPGVQTGPIDRFSMRISFGKGWGCYYKRPDVTLCPCWLEVLFKPQR